MKDFVMGRGADIFGVADMTDAAEFVRETYGEYYASFPRAVSFAIFFPKEVVNEQLAGPTRNYMTVYTALNREIDHISAAAAVRLQKAGYKAYPVAASDYRPAGDMSRLHWRVAEAGGASSFAKVSLDIIGAFGHRTAAVRAGLGWIGKSCSIVNGQVGPRLRLGTVLTDAPFEPDAPVENRCGGCTECAKACPVHALRGRTFDASEPLSERFDVKKCFDFWDDMDKVYGLGGTCGLCLAACPWGK
ncbi:4Fe-4S double cluster binding domain-containing protein [Cloacibacillus sp. An23]|uniref:4Fe-4S double cluster binding domain-containing protein n=1 Tax=Cloacibacillus sp. An23 TaxID=1965591 RepID=UPI001302D54F|nr:4Fe-4S double cluster binding domain-containing protein [Cloacibacillus sp. An23]